MEKATRRGNYDSGSDYVLEYGELRFSLQRGGLRPAGRAGGREARLRRRRPGRRRAPRPARARRQRRDPRAQLDRSASTSTSTGPSSSAPPTAASCTGSAASSSAAPGSTSGSRRASSTSSSTRQPHLRLRPARSRRRADRALARALLGRPRLPALERPARQAARRSTACPRSARAAAPPPRPAPGRRAASAGAAPPRARSASRSCSSFETRHSAATQRRHDAGGGELGVERHQRALGRDRPPRSASPSSLGRPRARWRSR